MERKPVERGEAQAQAQYDWVLRIMTRLEAALDDATRDVIQEEIGAYPVAVAVRSGWTTPGKPLEAAEYRILFCWGGPAVRIVGKLDEHHTPDTARVEHHDWGRHWTTLKLGYDAQVDVLLPYARCCLHQLARDPVSR